jgi:hypothetical protein
LLAWQAIRGTIVANGLIAGAALLTGFFVTKSILLRMKPKSSGYPLTPPMHSSDLSLLWALAGL